MAQKIVKVRAHKRLDGNGKIENVDAHVRKIDASIKRGSVVKNQFGEKRTVLDIVDNTTVWTYEEPNTPYSVGKLFKNGSAISKFLTQKI